MRGLIVGFVFCLSACGGTPDDAESQLRSWLSSGEQAVEAKDRRALMKMVSASYADSRGNDHAAIENLLRFYFLRQDSVTLATKIDSLEIFDETAAEVQMSVAMAGSNDNAIGFSADAKKFLLELELVDDEWQLQSARWSGLGEEF